LFAWQFAGFGTLCGFDYDHDFHGVVLLRWVGALTGTGWFHLRFSLFVEGQPTESTSPVGIFCMVGKSCSVQARQTSTDVA
jgi:hypothetical protein